MADLKTALAQMQEIQKAKTASVTADLPYRVIAMYGNSNVLCCGFLTLDAASLWIKMAKDFGSIESYQIVKI